MATVAPVATANATPAPAPHHHAANSGAPSSTHAGAYPSDEQILGITDDAASSAAAASTDDAEFDALLANAANASRVPPPVEPTLLSASSPSHQADKSVGSTNVALPPDAPEWLARASAAAPDSAPQLASLWQRANALDTFDRAYYGADAAAQQALVAQLYADDPAALRAMVAAAQQFIAAPATASRVTPPSAPPVTPTLLSANARNESADPPRRVGATNAATAAPAFNPAAYAQFEQSTNDAVVTDVNRAIERALDRALPDNISDGARRRIAGDTLAEVHTALRGDSLISPRRSPSRCAADNSAPPRATPSRASSPLVRAP